MRYIIMCGGRVAEWETPRQLLEIGGEAIVARTIRLLREAGVDDIAISSHDPSFLDFGVPVLIHENNYYSRRYNDYDGHWYECFYPTKEPVCYIFGDVVFSPAAIRTIVGSETDDIELFGSMPPFAPEYPKRWIEPFALKVTDTDHLKAAIARADELDAQGAFWRQPIMWELWTVIRGHPLQTKADEYVYDYTAINDYTCDVDHPCDVAVMERLVNEKA